MPGLQTDIPANNQSTGVRSILQHCVSSPFSAQFTHTSLRIRFSLLEHASNKHNKGLADCFPGVSV